MAVTELIDALLGYGQIVTGERFVGRDSYLKRINERFLNNSQGANISICGLPRIGKTSLAKQATRLYEESRTFNPKHVVCYIDFNASCRGLSVTGIYLCIFKTALNQIRRKRRVNKDIMTDDNLAVLQDLVSKIENDCTEGPCMNPLCDEFMYKCKESGISLRFIFDEFDSLQSSFRINDGCLDLKSINALYATLRIFATDNEQYSMKLLIISRNALYEIEPDGVESKLSGVCEQMTMTLFDRNDMQRYWNRLKGFDDDGILTDEHMAMVEYYAGNYPYWLDMVNDILLQGVREGLDINDERLHETLHERLNQQYETVLRMLDSSCYIATDAMSLKSILIQTLVGPHYTVRKADVNRLVAYQIICVGTQEDRRYMAVSEYFHEYLKEASASVPIWSQLTRFEELMRELLHSIVAAENIDTEQYLKEYHKGIYNVLDGERNKSIKKYGMNASQNLVDYLHMSHYFPAFIKPKWYCFTKVFTSFATVDVCSRCFTTLTNVRNPMAHSNSHFLSRDDILQAEEYIKICINHIESYFAKLPNDDYN